MTARPEELLFMVFMDYTNCTYSIHTSELSLPGGTLPLGVEIQQLTFMFNCPPLQNMYFVKLKFINKSLLNWDSVYICSVNDQDIGDASNDALGCDTLRNMSFGYNFGTSDPVYGENPPALGISFLQSPLRYTGNNNDTAKLPYDTLTGYRIVGLTAFNQLAGGTNQCITDPDNAEFAYNFLRGLNGCGEQMINRVTGQTTKFRYPGDACLRLGWYDSVSGDKKNFIGSGPFTMNSNDTQLIAVSYMITREGGNNFQNVCALQSLSDSALYHYYNDFKNCTPIGIQPISNEIPQMFELFQNFPNPFNPNTKIRFSIPGVVILSGAKNPDVKLVIYDALGREIQTLANQSLSPGIYEINWNAGNFPSGIYFYSLSYGNFTQTKKMALIK